MLNIVTNDERIFPRNSFKGFRVCNLEPSFTRNKEKNLHAFQLNGLWMCQFSLNLHSAVAYNSHFLTSFDGIFLRQRKHSLNSQQDCSSLCAHFISKTHSHTRYSMRNDWSFSSIKVKSLFFSSFQHLKKNFFFQGSAKVDAAKEADFPKSFFVTWKASYGLVNYNFNIAKVFEQVTRKSNNKSGGKLKTK